MRALLSLCLCAGVVAGELPLPGRDPAFLVRILADTKGGTQPWKGFKVPEAAASAVVEVVGEYSPEELRQVVFAEFLLWFREDLKRFWRDHGAYGPSTDWDPITRPEHRPGLGFGPAVRVGF